MCQQHTGMLLLHFTIQVGVSRIPYRITMADLASFVVGEEHQQRRKKVESKRKKVNV